MKRLQSLILFLVVVITITSEGLMAQKLRVETQGQQKYVIHKVQKGETLYSLSRAYDANVDELSRLNPEAAKVLKLGQEIRIPFNPPSVPKNLQSSGLAQETKHTVQQGEWLSKIARNYEVSVGDLKKWNNLENETLKPGQELIVGIGKSKSQKKNTSTRPANKVQNNTSTYAQNKTVNKNTPKNNLRTAPSTEITHTVVAGETLYSLKRKYGSDINQIRSRNQLSSDVLEIGQVLQIPVNPNVNTGNTSPANYTNNPNPGNTQTYNPANNNNGYTPPANNNNYQNPNTNTNPNTYQNPNTNTANNNGAYRGGGLPQNQPDKITHTVKDGEFLFDIAQAYGVNIRDVKAWNNLQSYYVEPGTNLVIYPNQRQGNANPNPSTPSNSNVNTNPANTGNTNTWRGGNPNTNPNTNPNNNTPPANNTTPNTGNSNPYANPYSNANYNYSTTSTSDDPIDQLNNSSLNTQARTNNTYQSPNTGQGNAVSTGNSYPNYNTNQPQTNPYANSGNTTSNNPNSNNIYNKKNVKEEGYADVIQNIPSPRPFVAMHREAPIGSLVIVKNTVTKKTVVVEIVGQSNPNETKAGVVIELAPAAFQRLGAVNNQALPVEITYMKK